MYASVALPLLPLLALLALAGTFVVVPLTIRFVVWLAAGEDTASLMYAQQLEDEAAGLTRV
ncbi:hypothetical protein GCM10027026_00530 [Myroides odoratimimus subsp. xuanwuensis]